MTNQERENEFGLEKELGLWGPLWVFVGLGPVIKKEEEEEGISPTYGPLIYYAYVFMRVYRDEGWVPRNFGSYSSACPWTVDIMAL